LSRNPATNKDADCEYLLFERYESGQGRGTVGETAIGLDERTLHLVDMTERYSASTTDVVADCVVIPYSVIGFDPSRDSRHVSVPRSGARARLLETAFDAVGLALAAGDVKETNDLADAFVGLVQRLMLGRDKDTDLQNADSTLDLALRQYIETHLADPDLGSEHLCRRFGLSRASLYRRFRDEGGIEHYIAGRRLDRCLQELCASEPTRGLVMAIANRWGFTDPGNFNRRFRKRFDLAPSECLASNGTLPVTALNGRQHIINHWMNRHR
jgi:AraC-like DNA-binding protein